MAEIWRIQSQYAPTAAASAMKTIFSIVFLYDAAQKEGSIDLRANGHGFEFLFLLRRRREMQLADVVGRKRLLPKDAFLDDCIPLFRLSA